MRNEFRLAVLALFAGLTAIVVTGFGQAPEPSDRYYECIRKNDLGMLNALIDYNGVKCKDKHATTPLHYAAANGSVEALRKLLEGRRGSKRAERFRRHAVDVGDGRTGKGAPPGGRRRRREREIQDGPHRALPGGGDRWKLGHGEASCWNTAPKSKARYW